MVSTSGPKLGSQSKYIALSVPGARSLGVAGRTSLYPALSVGANVRTFLRTSLDVALLSQSRRQILIVAEAPDERHQVFLHAASRIGCPTLIVLLYDSPLADVLQLVAGIDPDLIKVADPLSAGVPHLRKGPTCGALLVPAHADLDRLLFAKFPSLRWPATDREGVRIEASEPCITVIAAKTRNLARIAAPLSRALRSYGNPPLLIVGSNAQEFDVAGLPLGLTAQLVDEGDPSWLGYLRHSRVVLVPSNADDANSGPSLNGAIWTLTALRAGVPVITDANPLLDSVAGCFISDDWERGLSLYAESSGVFRAVDAAIGQAKTARLEQWHRASPVDKNHWWLRDGVPFELRTKSEKSVLLAFLDLAQDLDVLLPVLQALRRRDQFHLRICVTDWLLTQAPRTFTILKSEGFVPEVILRKQTRTTDATSPSLDRVDAVLTASESNQGPHRAAHRLAKRAERAAIPTFTLQHGFENIGLTYKDPSFGANVRFASSQVFVWFAAEHLPTWVPADTFARVIPTGSPKTAPPLVAAPPLPQLGTWFRKIGVFENLHWHRFSERYKREFFTNLDMAAEFFPETLFLIKPHSAGRWLLKNPDLLPRRQNVRLVDPLQPEWAIFTAPALIKHIDAVITTPSTVAVDGARAGRPVAVAGYGLELPLYDPLPILSCFEDWCAFINLLSDTESLSVRNEFFLRRNFLPYAGQYKIADAIYATVHRQN